MAKDKKPIPKKVIEQYEHQDKQRLNNPPVGLVDAETDQETGKKPYAFDPHLDPQLVWAGKAERTSFEVPTVSLHVHERIEPRTIIEAVRKKNGPQQPSMFDSLQENPPLREAIEFYKHSHGWSNRLIAGDSLLVMNSLLEKEGMAGKIQMIYIDPPYGIKYGSNFQPFVNKRDVKDGKDEDLTQEPEQIRAFRDTWELGVHSYLSYLRDRLLLARELLTESGSVFVQISDENIHHVRELMDEVLGAGNFVSQIAFLKTSAKASSYLDSVYDILLWYSKCREQLKYSTLYYDKVLGGEGTTQYIWVDSPDGKRQRRMTNDELAKPSVVPQGWRIFAADNLTSQSASATTLIPFEYEGKTYYPGKGGWKSNQEGLMLLAKAKRLMPIGKSLMYKRYLADFSVYPINNIWRDTLMTGFSENKTYVVQTSLKAIKRCLLMTTDPGDLVFDPTCGSGTTAYVAEQWGRRWITCDTSRVAIALAKQRLMTAAFDYYELAHPQEGVGSGFKYKTVPHIMLKSIANNEPPGQETLYDQPYEDNKKVRVTGPFTVEAVPAPAVKSLGEFSVSSFQFSEGKSDITKNSKLKTDNYPQNLKLKTQNLPADASIARSGETLRQSEWRDELLKAGIRAKGGKMLTFSRVEPLSGTRWLHADGEFLVSSFEFSEAESNSTKNSKLKTGNYPKNSKPKTENHSRAVISFGPEHAPLEQRQVELAIEEARKLVPRPKIVIFASFHFDPEAAKDIDETEWPGVALLKVQMNTDLLTEDLKKKRSSNESFWLIGQPDVRVLSFEFLVFSGGEERRLCEYGTFKELSGLGGLAEVNQLGREDLFFYALLSQGRDVWRYLADTEGWDFSRGEYRGGAGKKQPGGVPAVSWNSPRLLIGIRDLDNHLAEFGIPDRKRLRELVERLRGNRETPVRLKKIAEKLNYDLTKNSKLKTQNLSQVEVLGFDYYNPVKGEIESGGKDKIAMWMLDTDYDGRSLLPRQFFFPMAGENEGWARLARNLKAEIDEELIEAYRGTVSLPFEAGDNKRVAVKIVDDRGIESLKIIDFGD